jgi:hypothetical protein
MDTKYHNLIHHQFHNLFLIIQQLEHLEILVIIIQLLNKKNQKLKILKKY